MAYLDDIHAVLQVAPSGVPTYVRLSQNENGRRMIFSVAGGEIPSGSTATISGTKPDGVVYSATCAISGSTVTVDETIQLTAAAGEWDAKIRITNGGNVISTGRIRFVIDADTVDPGAVPSDSELEGLVAEAAGWAENARSDAYGSPLAAPTAAEMTDTSRVYVYTGSESGYTFGNWYYWNGSAWASGGVYNSTAVQTDKTLSIPGMAADAEAVGKADSELKADLRQKSNNDVIYADDFEPGYYSTVNGEKLDNSSSTNYSRTKSLIPADENTLYFSNVNIIAACFDRNYNFISGITIYQKDSAFKRQRTPEGTVYVGLSATNPQYFRLKKANPENIRSIEYPYNSDDYAYIPAHWCNGSGNINATANFDLFIVPVSEGEKWYVSNEASYNLLCFDNGRNLLTADYETRKPIGKVVTVPANAKTMCVNLYNKRTKGVNDEMSDYIARVDGERILAIGDSITWLDGRANYGEMAYFSGWQRKLRLAGHDTISAGFSGYPYATGLDVVDGVDHSIYNEIVTKEYDVSGYDCIILFGGTNDVLYGGELGNRPTEYANRTFDSSKFNGALGAIISYIRTNNQTAKIILASFPKSEAVSRIFPNAKSRVDEIEYNAEFWSCYYNDIFRNMNVQPTYDQFDTFFYDSTHPNFSGMERIGELMLEAVNIA